EKGPSGREKNVTSTRPFSLPRGGRREPDGFIPVFSESLPCPCAATREGVKGQPASLPDHRALGRQRPLAQPLASQDSCGVSDSCLPACHPLWGPYPMAADGGLCARTG